MRNLLTGVTDALGNVRSFTYNNAGWLTNSEDLHVQGDPSFGSTSFTYDANGNQLVEIQPNGNTVTRTYDLLDRPTSIVDGTPLTPTNYTLTYDSCTKGVGRLCGVSGTFPNYGLTFGKSFVYGASMPSSTTMTTLGNTYTTSYQYTLSDEVSRITHPNGTVVRYAFGDWALPSTVYTKLPGGTETTFATAVYHHTLQPETITISTGPTLSYTYDGNKLYRTASFSAVMGTTTLQSYAYSYDNLNNVTQVAEPGLTKTYTYDDLYRLIQAVHTASAGQGATYTYAPMCSGSSGGNMIFADDFETGDTSRWGSGSGLPDGQLLAQSFSYNAIGNITSANCNNYTNSYTYSGTGKTNPHAVTSIGSNLYAYDENGNVVTAPNQVIAYNWQNQPVSITSGTTSTVFAYDETGKRFLYQIPTTKEIQVSEEYLVRGGAPEIVVKLGKMPIGLVTGGAIYSTITDHLGTPVKQANSSGTTVESTSYGPFGSILSQTGTLNSKRGFIGQEYDEESSLSYLQARYYDGTRGQFVSQDPVFWEIGISKAAEKVLQDPQSQNAYSYARNNPLTYTDADGRLWKEINDPALRNHLLDALGSRVYELHETSPAWAFALDHPYITGAAVGVGSGLAALGGATVLTAGSEAWLAGAGTTCIAFCGTVGQQAVRYADSLSKGVSNPRVLNTIRSIYQSTDNTPGGTFGALRNEIITGEPTGSTFHFEKTINTLNRISNILQGEKLTKGDLRALQIIVNNLSKEVPAAAIQKIAK